MLIPLLSLLTKPNNIVELTTPPQEQQDEDVCCRICYGSDTSPSNMLFQPCMCRGSVGYVHTECLQAWRRKGSSSTAHSHCSNCKFAYKIQSCNHQRFLAPTSKHFAQITVGLLVLSLAALNALLLPQQVSHYMLSLMHWNFTSSGGVIRHLAFGMSCFTVCGFLTLMRNVLTDSSGIGRRRRPALLYTMFAMICVLCSENIAPPMVLFAIVEGISPAGEALWELTTRWMESDTVLPCC